MSPFGGVPAHVRPAIAGHRKKIIGRRALKIDPTCNFATNDLHSLRTIFLLALITSGHHPASHRVVDFLLRCRWSATGRITMKTKYTVALSMLAGAALGAAAIQGLHAQGTPLVYYVAEIDVTNPDAYAKEYAPKAQAIIKAMGGRQLAIGGTGGAGAKPVTAVDGEAPKRVVIQVWDNMEKMNAWRANPEFIELRKTVGDKYAKFRSFAIEGVSP